MWSSRGLFASLLLLGLLSAGFVEMVFADRESTVDVRASETKAVSADRIAPNQVTLSNLDAFEEQVRRDLPLGTSKEEVEAYLDRLGIRHSYVGPEHFSTTGRNSIHALVEDIGTRMGLRASLAIRIFLDDETKVREIKFRVDYL